MRESRFEQLLEPQAPDRFSDSDRRALYDAIALRRDVRHFVPDAAIRDDVLQRILSAAHQAPSVGLSQPWGFVLVRDHEVRSRIRESFLCCREAEAARFPAELRAEYLAHKLEGILEATLNICVAVDLRDRDRAILGTTVQPESVRASACCAIQNLWLAARVEGIGVGWVSIVEPAVLRRELHLPAGVEPVAYLCVGRPVAFRTRPMLEETGWGERIALDRVIHPAGRWRLPSDETRAVEQDPTPPETARAIRPPCELVQREAHRWFARQTRPQGSLGRLEDIACRYAAARRCVPPPAISRATLLLFAADHGVAAYGVSAYGSPMTAHTVVNIMAGGSTINALARSCDVELRLTDVGIAGDLSAAPTAPTVPLLRHPLGAGTRSFLDGPAMTHSQARDAIRIGAEIAHAAIVDGASLVGVGEIGIANTTSAAAIIAAVTGIPPARCVGPGTGLDEDAWKRKMSIVTSIVEAALARHRKGPADPLDPLDLLATLGGFELGAIAGAIVESARLEIPIVLDGVITLAASLIAVLIEPACHGYLIASHGSTEPAGIVALAHLGLVPLLDLGMRLGEGSCSVLGMSMVRAAVAAMRETTTFATAGIVDRVEIDQHR